MPIGSRLTGFNEQAFTYIADSALVTEANLAALEEGIGFITRLPATYGECDRVIRAAVAADEWESIGRIALHPPPQIDPAPTTGSGTARSPCMARPTGPWWCTPVPTTSAD